MATLAQIRTGVQTRVNTIASLDGRAHAYWPQKIVCPCCVIDVTNRRPYVRSGKGNSYTVKLTIFAGQALPPTTAGQALRDQYLDSTGTNSLQAAIEGDTTLGGVASSCVCQAAEPGPLIEWPVGSGAYYWGGSQEIEIRD